MAPARGWSLQAPPGGSHINWGHPLSLGLVSCLHPSSVGGGFFIPDLANGQVARPILTTGNPPTAATPNFAVGPVGPAITFAKANALAYRDSLNAFGSNGGTDHGFSFDLWFRLRSTSNGAFNHVGRLVSSVNAGGLAAGIGGSDMDSSGTNLIFLNENRAWHPTSITLATAKWYYIACTYDLSNNFVGYLNGISVQTWNQTPSAVSGASPFYHSIGGYSVPGGASRFTDCDFAAGRVWQRILSPGEITQLYGDPYCFMQPQPPRFRFGALNPAVTGQAMVWNGSAWVKKPAMVWNGSAWVQKPVEVWTGAAWKAST